MESLEIELELAQGAFFLITEDGGNIVGSCQIDLSATATDFVRNVDGNDMAVVLSEIIIFLAGFQVLVVLEHKRVLHVLLV
jgi:hypothetical protein